MNAETLHSIGAAVRADLRTSGIRERLAELEAALTSSVNSPNDPSYAQQVVTAREQLRSAVSSSLITEFPPIWLEYLDEMGVADVVGDAVLGRIEAAFRENQITPPAVLAEVSAVRQRLDEVSGAFDQMVAGMAYLAIGTEVLEPGEVELAFLIPRTAVRNELGSLGKEFTFLKQRVIGPFQELATGSRSEVEVRTIASSDFSLLLGIDLDTARLIASSIGFLIEKYKQILDIRKVKAEIEKLEMPAEIANSIELHATSQMSSAIADLTDRVMAEYSENLSGAERAHEVRSDLHMALEGAAVRIDIGYSIQIRSTPPELPQAEEADDEGAPSEDVEALRIAELHAQIAQLRETLSFLRLEGSPILGLPAPTDRDDDGEGRESSDASSSDPPDTSSDES